MATTRRASSPVVGALLNLALIVGGIAALMLLYALANRFLAPRADAVRETNPAELYGEIIQVDVRNGCGDAGLAATTTAFLRDRGFDVVESGNVPDFGVERSEVVDRIGDEAAALKVAAALGIPEARVREERRDVYLDASVILGCDYATLRPFE
ncbi:MAG: LytR C-terminal domain-containing protein [Bacteroidota bacterium]